MGKKLQIDKQGIVVAVLSSIAYAIAAVTGVVFLLGLAGIDAAVKIIQFPVCALFFWVFLIGILALICATNIARALRLMQIAYLFGLVGLVCLGVGGAGGYVSYRKLDKIQGTKSMIDRVSLSSMCRPKPVPVCKQGKPLLCPSMVIKYSAIVALCNFVKPKRLSRIMGVGIWVEENGRVRVS